jgi:hypothetical protein
VGLDRTTITRCPPLREGEAGYEATGLPSKVAILADNPALKKSGAAQICQFTAVATSDLGQIDCSSCQSAADMGLKLADAKPILVRVLPIQNDPHKGILREARRYPIHAVVNPR